MKPASQILKTSTYLPLHLCGINNPKSGTNNASSFTWNQQPEWESIQGIFVLCVHLLIYSSKVKYLCFLKIETNKETQAAEKIPPKTVSSESHVLLESSKSPVPPITRFTSLTRITSFAKLYFPNWIFQGGVQKNLLSPPRGVDKNLLSPPRGVDKNLLEPPRGVDNNLLVPPRGVDKNLLAPPRGVDNNLLVPPRGVDKNLLAPPWDVDKNLLAPPGGIDKNLLAPPRGVDNNFQGGVQKNLLAPPRGVDKYLLTPPSRAWQQLIGVYQNVFLYICILNFFLATAPAVVVVCDRSVTHHIIWHTMS